MRVIHPGHGVYRFERSGLRHDTLLANVSLVNEKYEPVYGVTLFDYEPASGDMGSQGVVA